MSAAPNEQLQRCRETIDRIDLQLLRLLNERTEIVEEIGRVKQLMQMAIYEPKREEQVFHNVLSHNSGPLPNDAVQRIFERVIDEMRTIQKMKIVEGKS
jgi:chorismate mutase-like protein